MGKSQAKIKAQRTASRPAGRAARALWEAAKDLIIGLAPEAEQMAHWRRWNKTKSEDVLDLEAKLYLIERAQDVLSALAHGVSGFVAVGDATAAIICGIAHARLSEADYARPAKNVRKLYGPWRMAWQVAYDLADKERDQLFKQIAQLEARVDLELPADSSSGTKEMAPAKPGRGPRFRPKKKAGGVIKYASHKVTR